MTNKDIQQLVDKYFAGETTPAEEQQLALALKECEDLSDEWQAVSMMLGELTLGEAEYDEILANREKQAPVIKRMYPRWMAAAASLLIIICVGAVLLWSNNEQLSSDAVAKTEKQACKTTEGHIENAPSLKMPDSPSEGIGQTADSRRTNDEKKEEPEKIIVNTAADEADEIDPYLHYASHEEKIDTMPYQDPARVNEYIAKLAEANNVKEGTLKCSLPCDSNVVSAVYVFPDKDEINLFGRLLQLACWYKSETPGYRLTFSNQQFFFELKDMRRQLHYHWIAERINGKILFYATHAPLGTNVSSACYQEYCNELMHINSINKKPRKI